MAFSSSSAPATPQAGKRKLEDTFSDIMSPPVKRLCSSASPSTYEPQLERSHLPPPGLSATVAESQEQQAQPQHYDDQSDSSPLTDFNSSSVISEDEFDNIHAQRTEDGRDETQIQVQIDDARGEIEKIIAFIKSLTPDDAIDNDTANLLIAEITDLSGKRGLVNTPEEVAAMQNVFGSGPSRAASQASSQASSPTRETDPVPPLDVDAGISPPASVRATQVDISTIMSETLDSGTDSADTTDTSCIHESTYPAIPSGGSASATRVPYVDTSTCTHESHTSPTTRIAHPDGYISSIEPANEVRYMSASTCTNNDDVDSASYVTSDTQTGPVEYFDVGVQTAPTKDPIISDLELWKRELEGICRPEPLVHEHEDGTNVITVITKLRPQPSAPKVPSFTSQPVSSRVSLRKTQPSSIINEKRFSSIRANRTDTNAVIDLDGDSDDGEDSFARTRRSFRTGGAGMRAGTYDTNYTYSGLDDRDSVDMIGTGDRSTNNFYNDDGNGVSMYASQAPSARSYPYPRMASGDVPRTPPQRGPPREEPSFYGISGDHSRQSATLLRYQDRVNAIGLIPSPRNGLRLNLENYLNDVGFEHQRNVTFHIGHILQQSSWNYRTCDDDESLRRYWNETYLMKGFPLVEDVTFLVHQNHVQPNGDCYWRALSFSLYGHGYHWDLVKAEHLGYLCIVLSSPRHSRYELYSETLNSKFFLSASDDGGTAFKANLWQLLHMPQAWTPGAMQQVTADLYNVHLVTFSYDAQRQARGEFSCAEVSALGAYNARHVFMLYRDGNHFQPMTPNAYLGWEFRYPRITVAATARFANAPRPGSRRVASSRAHPWRNDFTREVPAPVPRTHGCDVERLRGFMVGGGGV